MAKHNVRKTGYVAYSSRIEDIKSRYKKHNSELKSELIPSNSHHIKEQIHKSEHNDA